MMAVTEFVKNPNENKKRRGTKRTKLSWRKQCDVKDVDKFLEEKLLEERLGAPFSERPNEELFQIDTKPETVLRSSKAEKRAAAKNKPLRCFAIFKSTSAVQDPISKRNRVLTKEEKHPLVTRLNTERLQKGLLTQKEKMQAKDIREAKQKRKIKKVKKEDVVVATDLWSEESAIKENPFGVAGTWLNQQTVLHTLNNTGRKRKTIPKSIYQKLSTVSAVEPPHPGMSYNPSFEDHQALLREIAETDAKVTKEEKHLARVTRKMFSKVTREQTEKSWMTEMLQGLPTENVKEDPSDVSDGEYMPINPPAKNAKKQLKKRRKLKELKQEEIQRKRAKVERKKLSDIIRLSVVQKEVAAQEAKIEKLRDIREKVKGYKALETKRLGRNKFQPAEPDFNMGQDIAGNLRNVKTEGSLLFDRYKSLQKRNVLIPSTGPKSTKKPKTKKFEKNTYKMGWEPKGY